MTALALTAGDLLTGLLIALVLAAVVFVITRIERHPAERNLTELFEEDERTDVDLDWQWPERKAGPESRERVDDEVRERVERGIRKGPVNVIDSIDGEARDPRLPPRRFSKRRRAA